MNMGFTVRTTERQLEVDLLLAQNSAARRLVSVARDHPSQSAAVLLGQLHYRDEIGARLLNSQVNPEVSHADLALAAYLQSGTAGLQRLEGEFSLVVWDGRRRRLIGMRDPLGSWPLYWTAPGPFLAMSTNLRSLGDGNGRSPLDADYIAEFLITPFIDSEIPSTRTSRSEVQRVLPGTLVDLSFDMKPQQHSYWNWSSRIERIAADRLEDVADRFCELLDRAVRERMQDGRVATHLSGGMDSSAVTILARRTAETEARDPIATISLTHDAAELAAERSYIKLVLNQGGPVDPHFISADEAVGFDWFRCPMPEHHEPYAGLWSLAANRLLVDVANHCRVKSVLTGAGADEILTYRPLHIADLLRRGRLISAIREAARWAEGQGQGIWTVLRQCGFGPLCPSGFRPFSWPLRWLGFTIPPRQGRWSIPPWIRADFVRKHQLHDRNQDFSRRLFAPPAAFSETLLRLAMASGDWARWHLYAPLGINISHPFLDPRVVCYALGIPRHVRAAPGDPKPLLRTAMQGLLPDAIQNRREKTGFDGPHARGMALHLTQLEELVWNSPLRDLGIVDPGKLISAMHQVAFGIGSDDNQWIDRTLALMAWSDANKRATVEYGRNNTVQSLVANPCC